MPQPYAPPEQFQPFEEIASYRSLRIVNISDGDAREHYVSDIMGDNSAWAWTGKRPMVKVKVPRTERVKYLIDFSVAGATLDSTGPVTITFLVNGHTIEQQRYTEPGEHHIEKDVPAEWLAGDADAEVGAEIDKVWTAPGDGAKLGFILTRVGLVGQ